MKLTLIILAKYEPPGHISGATLKNIGLRQKKMEFECQTFQRNTINTNDTRVGYWEPLLNQHRFLTDKYQSINKLWKKLHCCWYSCNITSTADKSKHSQVWAHFTKLNENGAKCSNSGNTSTHFCKKVITKKLLNLFTSCLYFLLIMVGSVKKYQTISTCDISTNKIQ